MKLQAAIRYGEGDMAGAAALIEQCSTDDPDTSVNVGCLLYREGNYATACKRFQQTLQVTNCFHKGMLRD